MESRVKIILNNENVRFLIYLIIAFIIFSPSFSNLSFFWDDERFIFLNPDFLNSPSWTHFWNPKTVFYKSWSLGYTIFWFLVKTFPAAGFVTYKSLNIIFHALNGYLTYRFIKKLTIPYPYIISMLFLIHPLHVESVSWIFQLMTILSYTFFISSLINFYNFIDTGFKKHIIWTFIFFLASLLTKSIALLIPFVFLIILIIQKVKLKAYLFLVPFFISSLYLGLVNNKGTEILLNEKSSLSSLVLVNIQKIFTPITQSKIQSQGKIPNTENDYFNFIFKKRHDQNPIKFNRGEIFSQGIWYYTYSAILPINLQYIHKSESTNAIFVILSLFFLIILPVILSRNFKDRYFLHIPLFASALLLPYLGISFITFFYWSNVSDRYTYYFILVFIFLLGLFLKHVHIKYAKFFIIFYILILSAINLNYGMKFNNNVLLYEEILTYKAHPGLYSLLIEQYIQKLDYKNANRTLEDGLKKFPEDENLKIDAERVNNLKKFYNQFEPNKPQ